jgi:cytochrome c-type biogenesis protein CcmH/NrfG
MDSKVEDQVWQEYDECLESIEKLAKKPSKPEIEVDNLEKLEDEIKNNPKDSFAFYRLGCYHYREAHLKECVEFFNKAILLNPSGAMQHAAELKIKATTISKAIEDGKLNKTTAILILMYLR